MKAKLSLAALAVLFVAVGCTSAEERNNADLIKARDQQASAMTQGTAPRPGTATPGNQGPQ